MKTDKAKKQVKTQVPKKAKVWWGGLTAMTAGKTSPTEDEKGGHRCEQTRVAFGD